MSKLTIEELSEGLDFGFLVPDLPDELKHSMDAVSDDYSFPDAVTTLFDDNQNDLPTEEQEHDKADTPNTCTTTALGNLSVEATTDSETLDASHLLTVLEPALPISLLSRIEESPERKKRDNDRRIEEELASRRLAEKLASNPILVSNALEIKRMAQVRHMIEHNPQLLIDSLALLKSIPTIAKIALQRGISPQTIVYGRLTMSKSLDDSEQELGKYWILGGNVGDSGRKTTQESYYIPGGWGDSAYAQEPRKYVPAVTRWIGGSTLAMDSRGVLYKIYLSPESVGSCTPREYGGSCERPSDRRLDSLTSVGNTVLTPLEKPEQLVHIFDVAQDKIASFIIRNNLDA